MDSKPHFNALLTYLPAKDGINSTPVSSGYRPTIKFSFEQELFIGIQEFIDTDLVFPGDVVSASITMSKRKEFTLKIYEGLDFEFYDGENLIGNGVITKVLF